MLPVEDIIDLVRIPDEFKPNCNLVKLDSLVKGALISPDEPDYLELVSGLHGVTCAQQTGG